MLKVTGIDKMVELDGTRFSNATGMKFYMTGWPVNSICLYIQPTAMMNYTNIMTLRYNMDTGVINRFCLEAVDTELVSYSATQLPELRIDRIIKGTPIIDLDYMLHSSDTYPEGEQWKFHVYPFRVHCYQDHVWIKLIQDKPDYRFCGLGQLAFGVTEDDYLSSIIAHSLDPKQYSDFKAWIDYGADHHSAERQERARQGS